MGEECKSYTKITFMTEKPNDSTIFTNGVFNKYTNRIFNEGLNLFHSKNNKMINSQNINEKKLVKKTRKYKTDLIRIKFMNKFFKSLIKQINKKLKGAGSNILFGYIPRVFILNFTRNILNKKYGNIADDDLTLENILSKQFCELQEDSLTQKRFNQNQDVLTYLQENKRICEESNFNIFKVKKFSEIFYEYLYSKEFGKEIYSFKNKIKPEDDEYIRNYIFRAIEFQNFV